MIEAELMERETPVMVSFMLIHIDHPGFWPIIENWPIPHLGMYVSISTPSPFAENEYIDMAGVVKAVKYIFFDQELPNGERVSRNTAHVLLENGADPIGSIIDRE